jgi:hypothetical protein
VHLALVESGLGVQVVLARNALLAFFISLIPALIPVIGLKVITHRQIAE